MKCRHCKRDVIPPYLNVNDLTFCHSGCFTKFVGFKVKKKRHILKSTKKHKDKKKYDRKKAKNDNY